MISECNYIGETVVFTRPIVFAINNMSESIFSVYAMENGTVQFDTNNPNIDRIDLNSIPIECLVLMKQDIENTITIKKLRTNQRRLNPDHSLPDKI